jgi:hypothetical protein
MRQIVVCNPGNTQQLRIVGGGIGADGVICGAYFDEGVVYY